MEKGEVSNYDWEQIMATKTEQELFAVYSGDHFLDNNAIQAAKAELERRNFNFNQIDYYQKIRKLEHKLSTKQPAILRTRFHKISPGIIVASIFLMLSYFYYIAQEKPEYYQSQMLYAVSVAVVIFILSHINNTLAAWQGQWEKRIDTIQKEMEILLLQLTNPEKDLEAIDIIIEEQQKLAEKIERTKRLFRGIVIIVSLIAFLIIIIYNQKTLLKH